MALQDLFFNQKDERVADYLYSILHYYFDLPGRHALSAGRSESVTKSKDSNFRVTWGGAYIDSFRITGRKLEPQFFLYENSYGVYNRVDRDIAVPHGKRYAYDFSKIQDGTLSAKLEFEGDQALQMSDEIRSIMDIIGNNGPQQWKNIPLVYVETGPIYAGTGIPDRIYLQLPSVREPSEAYRNNLMQQIANHYNIGSYENINLSVQQDRATSSMNFVAQVKQFEPEFPFAYYASIGLIDQEGMVLMDTMLGPVRIPANSDEGKAQLLNAGQKIQEEERLKAEAQQQKESQQYVDDFFGGSSFPKTEEMPVTPHPEA